MRLQLIITVEDWASLNSLHILVGSLNKFSSLPIGITEDQFKDQVPFQGLSEVFASFSP